MIKYYFIIGLIIGSLSELLAQGCSDAGICYITPNIKEDREQLKNSIGFGYIFGKGLEDVTYNNGFISYTRAFSGNLNLSSRITYNQASGDFGTLGHLGDLFLIANYSNMQTKNSLPSLSFGIKVPFNTGNLKINNVSLPMDYQTSLGTFDALLGIEYKIKKWNFDAAFQLPVLQTNRNSYFDDFSASDDFPTTNLFRRKPDLLVRSAFVHNTTDKRWIFRPELMAIFHLGNDSYEDMFGMRQTIDNSAGLTINASMNVGYGFNSKSGLLFNIASPLVVREIRPDGLTRSIVASLTYHFQF